MESATRVWNGDVDLANGQLQELREMYESRVNSVTRITSVNDRDSLELELLRFISNLDEDIPFLDEGFQLAVENYRKKFDNRSTPEEALKNANWNVVEFQTLLQQAQMLKIAYEEQLSCLNPAVFVPLGMQSIMASLRALVQPAKSYLRNLFKKKRTAATHILVLMLSDERRNKKPCALPVRYVAYRSLCDQYVCDITKDVKVTMKERGFNLVGKLTILP